MLASAIRNVLISHAAFIACAICIFPLGRRKDLERGITPGCPEEFVIWAREVDCNCKLRLPSGLRNHGQRSPGRLRSRTLPARQFETGQRAAPIATTASVSRLPPNKYPPAESGGLGCAPLKAAMWGR
jgi:hypothetical protein